MPPWPIPVKEVDGASGRLILIFEEGGGFGAERFNRESASARGLAISATHPRKLRARIENSDFLWIATGEGGTGPSRIDNDGIRKISKFLESTPGGPVYLDSLEYLTAVNGSKSIIRFVKRLCDMVSEHDGCLVASVHPWGLGGRDPDVLAASFDVVERRGVGARVIDGFNSGEEEPGFAYLFFDKSGYSLLRRFKEDALCMSTIQPAKLKRWYDFQGEVIWISESGAKGSTHPGRLGMEIKQRATRAAGKGHWIFVDSVEHLVMYTDFRETVGFLKSIMDSCARSDALMAASVNPGSIDRRELTILRRMFDRAIG